MKKAIKRWDCFSQAQLDAMVEKLHANWLPLKAMKEKDQESAEALLELAERNEPVLRLTAAGKWKSVRIGLPLEDGLCYRPGQGARLRTASVKRYYDPDTAAVAVFLEGAMEVPEGFVECSKAEVDYLCAKPPDGDGFSWAWKTPCPGGKFLSYSVEGDYGELSDRWAVTHILGGRRWCKQVVGEKKEEEKVNPGGWRVLVPSGHPIATDRRGLGGCRLPTLEERKYLEMTLPEIGGRRPVLQRPNRKATGEFFLTDAGSIVDSSSHCVSSELLGGVRWVYPASPGRDCAEGGYCNGNA
jgi:hypothetical protein